MEESSNSFEMHSAFFNIMVFKDFCYMDNVEVYFIHVIVVLYLCERAFKTSINIEFLFKVEVESFIC